MKDRRLFWILLPLVLGVWALIVYRFSSAMNEGVDDREGMETARSAVSRSSLKEPPFVYGPGGRDPFRYQMPKPTSIARAIVRKEPPWEPPPLRLTGIVGVKTKKTAVVEDPSGATFFLQRGDTLAGVTITAIADSKVEYRYKRKHASWSLSPDDK